MSMTKEKTFQGMPELKPVSAQEVHKARLAAVSFLPDVETRREALEMLGIGKDFPSGWLGPVTP